MKILNVVKNIIYDVIILVLIVAIVIGILNRNKPVPLFGYYLFTVLSGSMQDTLHVGDNIIVKETKNYNVGDIITYKLDNAYITHRIVKIDGDYVTTKGDANTIDDVPFNKENILGKMVYKGFLLNFLINNKMIIIIILFGLLIIDMILKNVKRVDVNEKK